VSLCTGTKNETENETQPEETQKYKKKAKKPQIGTGTRNEAI